MINLQKGQRINLDKVTKYAMIGLGWDTNKYDGQYDFDLDASVFMLGAGDKLLRDEDFVFYNNPDDPAKALHHSGDDRTGGSSENGDDEKIFVDFSKIPANIQKLAIVVTIHEWDKRKQNFGMVGNAYIRLCNLKAAREEKGLDEVLRFDLTEDYSTETALLVAEIYRHNGEWKFAATGSGYKQGLAEFVRHYGGQC
jgi:tellurium resistance protein TerD